MNNVNNNNNPSRQMPSSHVAKEFGEVNIRNNGRQIDVQFTILMPPSGNEAEGWQTGVALDGSASMKSWYGRQLEGKLPADVAAEYDKRGWITRRVEDGRPVKSFQREAYADALEKGHLRMSENIVQPCAREFIAYLAGELDADGGTTVIYWACGDGSALDVVGDFSAAQCQSLEISGPRAAGFGSGTKLLPAVRYFVDRFKDAQRGMYLFITDGRLEDLNDVKAYTRQLARDISAQKRNAVKCVLVGLGNDIDEGQMEELDDLDTGTDVDVWDHKIAAEMRSVIEIFAEVVRENQVVAPVGVIYDSTGTLVKRFSDGLPASIRIALPSTAEWFELDVDGQRIRQSVLWPKL